MSLMKYSLIVPVYNRPDEVRELLESLAAQDFRDYEILIVEDGSSVPCADVVADFNDALEIKYFTKPNGGPGQARNFGAERAKGEWLIILDSDVLVPPGYFEAIEKELKDEDCDAFGGPDRAHGSFTPVQKAISYSMTSFFTTGGIRGGKKKLDKFYPRSFNMGIRRSAYAALGGFSKMRFGEDIDLSIRIFDAGYRCRLFPDAWVYHKRRTDFKKFFKQVHNSGIARINLYKKYPSSLKMVHVLPAVFTIGVGILLLILLAVPVTGLLDMAGIIDADPSLGTLLTCISLGPLLLYSLLIAADSFLKNKSLKVALLSVPASFVQLTGYGTGFIRAWWERCILGRGEIEAFKKNFYK